MIYQHTIHLEDTDAAGVVYFARLLSICHYAYEDTIAQAGVGLGQVLAEGELALPIVEAHIRFLYPLRCGERIAIEVIPREIHESEFEVFYSIYLSRGDRLASQATTRHVCINPKTRQRQPLMPPLAQWVRDSE